MKRSLVLLLTLLLLAACGTGTATVTGSIATMPTTPTTVAGTTGTPPVAGQATAPARSSATPARSAANVTAVANTTPAAAQALVEQALGTIFDRYVNDLDSKTIYGSAYNGAVETLRASGVTPQAQAPAFTGDRQADAAAFKAAYLALVQNAGPTINQSVVAYQAIGAVVAQIDECHTYFLTPEQNKQAKAASAGQENYSGIGVVMNQNVRPPTIVQVYKGSPAERAGLLAGDQIIRVGDTDVTNLPLEQVSPIVRGPEGSQVTLTIQRPGEPAPRPFTITRATITIPVFTKEVKTGPNGEKIGYMQLSSFSAQTTRTGVGDGVERDIQAALEEFESQGVQFWILDLRNNPGGYVETLRRVSSRFIRNGQPVAYYVENTGDEEAINTDRRAFFNPQHPFAVLINEGSGSSSEAFSAAAQDYGFGRLFGETTSGCLAAGQSIDLADGSAINVTVQKVVSPKKREINGVGVNPDQTVPNVPTTPNDETLDAAVGWLVAQPQP
jgi:carboxyl-terminal processing protease